MEDLIIECPECHANFYNINDSVLQKCPVCKKIFNIEQLEESESPYEADYTEEEESESPCEADYTREEESESSYESEYTEEESENAYILDDTSNEVLKDTTEANAVSNKQTESSKNTRGIIRNILYGIAFLFAIFEGEMIDPAKEDKNISPMVAFLILLPFILMIIWLIIWRIQGNF